MCRVYRRRGPGCYALWWLQRAPFKTCLLPNRSAIRTVRNVKRFPFVGSEIRNPWKRRSPIPPHPALSPKERVPVAANVEASQLVIARRSGDPKPETRKHRAQLLWSAAARLWKLKVRSNSRSMLRWKSGQLLCGPLPTLLQLGFSLARRRRRDPAANVRPSDFGFRPSFGFRFSDFGFAISRRSHGASSSAPDTLQTRFRFLAALDRNVRAPEECEMRTSARNRAKRDSFSAACGLPSRRDGQRPACGPP